MFYARKPTPAEIEALLATYAAAPCSYDQIGATRGRPLPSGYNIDHNRVLLGRGAACYERAKAAIGRWTMFSTGFTTIHPPAAEVRIGGCVAILARALGVWSLNFSRVIYRLEDVDEDAGRVLRSGFAYGTLADHVECGEERFSVEWRRGGDDQVWYDLLAFSRPHHPLARLGHPYVRLLQKRFTQRSLAAMRLAVAEGRES